MDIEVDITANSRTTITQLIRDYEKDIKKRGATPEILTIELLEEQTGNIYEITIHRTNDITEMLP